MRRFCHSSNSACYRRRRRRSSAVVHPATFFFNVIAAILFPWLGHIIGFSTVSGEPFGIFAGTAVNDPPSVTAAASTWDSMWNLGLRDARYSSHSKAYEDACDNPDNACACVPAHALCKAVRRRGRICEHKGDIPKRLCCILYARRS